MSWFEAWQTPGQRLRLRSGVLSWTNSRDSRGETAIPVTTTASTTPGINSEKVLPVVFLKTGGLLDAGETVIAI